MELRPYQREAIDAVYAHWQQGGGDGLLDMATGTGKAYVIATLCKELLAQWPSLRIVCTIHTRELVAQNWQELLRLWPQAPAGAYSAGLNRRDARAQIMFASIQSVYNKDIGPVDLLIIDECHLVPRSGDGMYRKFIAACRAKVPDMRILGASATPYRLDTGRLDRGEGALFERTVYSYGIGDGVQDGYLAPLTNKSTAAKISTEGVKTRGGEYIASSLENAVLASDVVPAAVAELVHKGQDRRAWLVFCAGIKHAEKVRDEVRKHGISCEMVTGETPNAERDRIIAAYKAGHVRCLTNVDCLTTGFNAPHVDLLAWMRPTLSTGLYVQGMGRGTRKAPGKRDCLVLDFAGNVASHGPVDAIDTGSDDAGSKDAKKKEPPTKICPNCESYVLISNRQCQDCGYEFPAPQRKTHAPTADSSTPVLTVSPPQWVDVHGWAFKVHNADHPTKLPTLQIDYLCDMTWHREWLCFDHDGYALNKARQAWVKLGGQAPAPRNVEEAYSRRYELRQPSKILMRPDGKWWRILSHRYEAKEAAE